MTFLQCENVDFANERNSAASVQGSWLQGPDLVGQSIGHTGYHHAAIGVADQHHARQRFCWGANAQALRKAATIWKNVYSIVVARRHVFSHLRAIDRSLALRRREAAVVLRFIA